MQNNAEMYKNDRYRVIWSQEEAHKATREGWSPEKDPAVKQYLPVTAPEAKPAPAKPAADK